MHINNCVDYHIIADLIPKIALSYFIPKNHPQFWKGVSLSPLQMAILFAIGLQLKSIDEMHVSLIFELYRMNFNYHIHNFMP